MKRYTQGIYLTIVGLLALTLAAPQSALAHCDGMDGPVVKAAQRALATGNLNFVLAWVQSKDEAEIRKAFTETLVVRELNPVARELADRYFFETLVRVHRAGEGQTYTGLKPAARDLGPAIPAADHAIENGSVDSLATMIATAAGSGVRERFKQVAARKSYATDDVAAGREYVIAYVGFVHYVETLHQLLHSGGHENSDDPQAAAPHHVH
ncbi:MAG TPA: DUF6448 family protein [Bryobacteraceae bacterium]|nr:DUF6448 family protein [Bryobacteraceae bacterium]